MRNILLTVLTLVLASCGPTPAAWNSYQTTVEIADGYSYNKKQALKAKDRASNDTSSEYISAKDVSVVNAEEAREYLYSRGVEEVRHGDLRKDGSDGSSGQDGISGVDGTSGQDGSNGQDGAAGSSGEDGEAGATGDQGVAGVDGTNGVDGKQGERGYRGYRGYRGRTGAQGEQGIQGEQGERGRRGAKGNQGNQGLAGEDGEDGESAHSCRLSRRNQECKGKNLYYDVYISCGQTTEKLGSYKEKKSDSCNDRD